MFSGSKRCNPRYLYRPKVWLFEGQFGGKYTVDSLRSVMPAAKKTALRHRPPRKRYAILLLRTY